MTYQATDRIDCFFAHHGIKGQKWGVRRFETEQGMLTEEGKRRYAKYNDGRYDDGNSDKNKKSSGKPKFRDKKEVQQQDRQLLSKRVKANKYRNEDNTLTDEGKAKFDKYAKELGYGRLTDSKFTAGVRAFVGRSTSNAIKNYGIRSMLSGAAGLSAMAKSRGPIDSHEVRKKEIAFFGGLGLAAVTAIQQHRVNKRRNYLIKYADSYGGTKAREIKEQAKTARTTARVTGLAMTGAEILNSMSRRRG